MRNLAQQKPNDPEQVYAYGLYLSGHDQDRAALAHIKSRLRATGEREVKSLVVGELVMPELQKLDEVAYIRFASVYRRFQDLNEFREEIDRLAREPVKK